MSSFGMPTGRLGGPRARCLGPELTAYADRVMDPATLRHWDRHLVACTSCRHAVESERRVLQSLRAPGGGPDLPGDLRSLLLSLASERAAAAPAPVPAVPVAPVPVRSSPVPVVDRGTPALHRSAVRATVFAGLAAGATAAAAWSLAVAGNSLTSPSPSTTQVRARPPAFVNGTAGTRVVTGSSVTAVVGWNARPALTTVRERSAQSTP